MKLVDARSLKKRYGAVTAVDDLSFEVEAGETFKPGTPRTEE